MGGRCGTGRDYTNPQIYGIGCQGIVDNIPRSCNEILNDINGDRVKSVTIIGLQLLRGDPRFSGLATAFQLIRDYQVVNTPAQYGEGVPEINGGELGGSGTYFPGKSSSVLQSTGRIPKIDYLPTTNAEVSRADYLYAYDILYDFVNNPACVNAFKSIRTDLVYRLTERGIRLGPFHLLHYGGIDFKERLGLTTDGLETAQKATAEDGPNAYAIGREEFLVENSLPTILLSSGAVHSGAKRLARTLAHELVHAFGWRARKLSSRENSAVNIWGDPGTRPHDLDYVPGFEDIIKNCTGHY